MWLEGKGGSGGAIRAMGDGVPVGTAIPIVGCTPSVKEEETAANGEAGSVDKRCCPSSEDG